ncbi:MAG TPA: primosomal protein N' [Clostridiales bacterium]|nr:primosomal protein N' [Clostridiales bacterium]
MIAEVIVDVASSQVDKIFDYSATEDTKIGCRVVVPFGKKVIDGICINLKTVSDVPSDKLKPIIRVQDEQPALTKEMIELMRFMVKRYHIPNSLALRQFLPSEMRKGKVRAKLVKFAILSNYQPDILKKNAKSQIQALEYLKENKREKVAVLNEKFSASAIKALYDKGLITFEEERVNRLPYSKLNLTEKKVEYTSEQLNAINSVEQSDKKINLIFGVTGSGKTEVYLNLIEKTIKQGKSVIMAVPEISLTPQMLSQLRARFKENVSILHSGLSFGERFDEWWRLRSGEAKIAIGARSVIFAPVENVGLIVIDEQHDSSYDSENSPRYSTFEIAKFRSDYNNCKIVLGSATPSVEVFLKAKNGEYGLIKMQNRINKRALPQMICVDMRKEVVRGNPSCYSGLLKKEISECLNSGNQAMIFLNRRGYSKQVICSSCGYVAKCEQCDVALNYHSDCNKLKCHYCGTTYKMLTACPECGSVNLIYGGTGTQRVVEELRKTFPGARILRMDNDTTQNKDGHLNVLKDFAEKKADILVGTQMIAKGHDFSSVTLVGILDADMSLFFSDYRSSERTFQLITQVAGRCGRGEKQGKVILQSYCPENPVLVLSARYDYEGFFEREIALRKTTHFPPFADVIRIMVESEEESLAIETLKNVYFDCKKIFDNNKEKFYFFNKMKSPVKRIKRKNRFQVLMRIKSDNCNLIDKFYDISEKYNSSKVCVYTEENPSSLV